MKILDKSFVPYIKNSDIEWRINVVAEKINKDFASKNPPLIICILKGAAIFHSQLLKSLTIPCTVDYMKINSYDKLQSTGQITLDMDLKSEVQGKEVIIVEDIIDTGLSMKYLVDHINQLNPSSISICTLFYKPSADQHNTPINYYGFHIPNKFVVGYGLDYDELGRNLKDLYILE